MNPKTLSVTLLYLRTFHSCHWHSLHYFVSTAAATTANSHYIPFCSSYIHATMVYDGILLEGWLNNGLTDTGLQWAMNSLFLYVTFAAVIGISPNFCQPSCRHQHQHQWTVFFIGSLCESASYMVDWEMLQCYKCYNRALRITGWGYCFYQQPFGKRFLLLAPVKIISIISVCFLSIYFNFVDHQWRLIMTCSLRMLHVS